MLMETILFPFLHSQLKPSTTNPTASCALGCTTVGAKCVSELSQKPPYKQALAWRPLSLKEVRPVSVQRKDN